MAKSIRSKSKRKNRTEFRNTIGTDVAKANMAIVQAKLQECVNSGQLNSFDRISKLFAGNAAADATHRADDDDDDIAMGNTAIVGKDRSKVPAKKSQASKHSKMTGMYGDKTSRKVGEKKFRRRRTSAGSGGEDRGRSRGRGSLEGRSRRSSSKKRSGKKLATI